MWPQLSLGSRSGHLSYTSESQRGNRNTWNTLVKRTYGCFCYKGKRAAPTCRVGLRHRQRPDAPLPEGLHLCVDPTDHRLVAAELGDDVGRALGGLEHRAVSAAQGALRALDRGVEGHERRLQSDRILIAFN